ncbi:hypothetical protein SLS62_002974 [Diatrype stigma]|uniref:Heterokaryon incompatibility domain-containing protein n=1 Tax=Diatrype stigma TaxID=117547 RepID=A0AAN9V5X4_9PEZI
MRLLNTTSFKLEEFPIEYRRPQYAILSHCWGEGEVLFEHMESMDRKALRSMKGYSKVIHSCKRARADGHRYIWIDTCCIDKRSSAELSLAINSMWNWYRHSEVCYAYLADVSAGDDYSFRRSRWFLRGWTLQELIAPEIVNFYDKNWDYIGSRYSQASQIVEITGIREHVLRRHTHGLSLNLEAHLCCKECRVTTNFDDILKSTSVATKMSWAKRRETTRIEDQSYCLLGLFGVYMPLLYGEGNRAWLRLLEEIIKCTGDQSILAFSHYDYTAFAAVTPFAPSPESFASNIEMIKGHSSKAIEEFKPYEVRGLHGKATLGPARALGFLVG